MFAAGKGQNPLAALLTGSSYDTGIENGGGAACRMGVVNADAYRDESFAR